MHTYSTDNDSRPTVYAILAITSFLIPGAIDSLTSVFSNLPFASGVGVSWGFIFAIVWKVYDRWGWKLPPVQWVGFTQVPDLNGKWEGWIVTSYEGDIPEAALHPEGGDEDGQKLHATLNIDQTWRKINVNFETENSSSDSTGATMLTDDGRWPSLSYQYENEGSPLIEGSDMHFGTASLEFRDDEDVNTLTGLYYTGPKRENHGRMYFKRQT